MAWPFTTADEETDWSAAEFCQSFFKAVSERRILIGGAEILYPVEGSEIQSNFLFPNPLYTISLDVFSGGSLTRAGTTATLSYPAGHNYQIGDDIQCYGVSQREYAGTHIVTAVTSTTLSYEVSGSPATPATPFTGNVINFDKPSAASFGWNSAQQATENMVTFYKNGGSPWTLSDWRAAAGINSGGFRRKKPREITNTTQTVDNDSNTVADGHKAYRVADGLIYTFDSAATPKWRVSEADKSVTSLTRSGMTVTATVTAHGYENGNRIRISGATQTAYNGDHVITVAGANTFTYEIATSPSTPATGTITAAKLFDGPPDTLDSDEAAPNHVAPGRMGTGDYIGPWIFNELKAGLNQLITPVTAVNSITFEYT